MLVLNVIITIIIVSVPEKEAPHDAASNISRVASHQFILENAALTQSKNLKVLQSAWGASANNDLIRVPRLTLWVGVMLDNNWYPSAPDRSVAKLPTWAEIVSG